MAVYPQLLAMLTGEANIAQTQAETMNQQAQTQQRMMSLLMNKQKMADDQAFATAYRNVGRGSLDNSPVGQSQDVPDDSPLGTAERAIQSLQKQKATLLEVSRVPSLSGEKIQDIQEQISKIDEKVGTETIALSKAKGDLLKQVGGIAGAIDKNATQEQLDMAMAQMRRLDPKTADALPLDRDPATGRALITPRTADTMQRFANTSLSEVERITRQQVAANAAAAEADKARLRDEQERNNLERNRLAAIAQAGAEAERAARSDARREGVEQRALTQAQSIQADYTKNPTVKEFVEKKLEFQKALKYVFNPDGTPKEQGMAGTKDWANFDSAGDFALSQQYLSLVHPRYRGSVAAMKDLEKLKNLPEKITSIFTRVATGKTLAQSDRINMVNTMKNYLEEDNAEVMKIEDDAMQRVRNLQLPKDVDPKNYVTPYAIRPKTEGEFKKGDVQVSPSTGKRRMWDGAKWVEVTTQ